MTFAVVVYVFFLFLEFFKVLDDFACDFQGLLKEKLLIWPLRGDWSSRLVVYYDRRLTGDLLAICSNGLR